MFLTSRQSGASYVRAGRRLPESASRDCEGSPSIMSEALVSASLTARGGGQVLKFRANQLVFRQGEPADAVYYIQSGKIRLGVVSLHGREGVVAIPGPGEFFGEGALACHAIRMASATTMYPSTVIRVARKAMIRLIRHEAVVSGAFMDFLLSRNAQIEADLIDHLVNSSERRLARVLLLLADFSKEQIHEAVVPKISQEVLAAKVGTTRSRINFFMNKFRRLGLIEYDGAQNSLKIRSALLDIIVRD